MIWMDVMAIYKQFQCCEEEFVIQIIFYERPIFGRKGTLTTYRATPILRVIHQINLPLRTIIRVETYENEAAFHELPHSFRFMQDYID